MNQISCKSMPSFCIGRNYQTTPKQWQLMCLTIRVCPCNLSLTHGTEAWWRTGLVLHILLMVSRRVTPKLYTSYIVDKVPSKIYSGDIYPLNSWIEMEDVRQLKTNKRNQERTLIAYMDICLTLCPLCHWIEWSVPRTVWLFENQSCWLERSVPSTV
jgi:hypothetical protein